MTDAIDNLIAAELVREGGWVDRPDDAGGPTNWGITLRALSAYLGRPATLAELRRLTPTAAAPIYRREFVDKPGFSAILDPDLRELVVDSGIQHSPERATRWLQAAAGLKDEAIDGDFGPQSQALVNKLSPRGLRARLAATRCRFYGTIVTGKPTNAVFAAGWANRLASFIEDLA